MVGQVTPGFEDRAENFAETRAFVDDAGLGGRREHQRRGVGRVGNQRLGGAGNEHQAGPGGKHDP